MNIFQRLTPTRCPGPPWAGQVIRILASAEGCLPSLDVLFYAVVVATFGQLLSPTLVRFPVVVNLYLASCPGGLSWREDFSGVVFCLSDVTVFAAANEFEVVVWFGEPFWLSWSFHLAVCLFVFLDYANIFCLVDSLLSFFLLRFALSSLL